MVFKALLEVVSDREIGGNKEDGGRLFSLVFSERSRGNRDKVQNRKFHLNIRKKEFL